MTSMDAVVITCMHGDAVPREHVLSQSLTAATRAPRHMLFYVNLLAMDVIAKLGDEDDVSSVLGPVAALKSTIRGTVEWHPYVAAVTSER